MMMRKIGIVGAGQMGAGIAQVVAQAGYETIVIDRDPSIAKNARVRISASLEGLVAKGRIVAASAVNALSNIQSASSFEALHDADLIIEAATEREDVKVTIFRALADSVQPKAILATNTSSIPITRMASTTPHPDRFIGLHFFNPVPQMKLVELIPGAATSLETVEVTRAFAESIGKVVIHSIDEPAFIVNRILCPMLNEAIFALGAGIGGIVDIDRGCTLGLNHPMGPLELSDYIGLDTLLSIMKTLQDTTGEDKYRPASLLRRFVDAGWLGRKSGRGFYDYSSTPPIPVL